jgi:hypothetical protein
MMKLFKSACLFLVILAAAAPANASAPEETPRFDFALDIIGTSQFEDINHLKKGMMRSDGADGVRVTRSSRNFTRIMGTFQGKREDFEHDLAGLAQDRFAVRVVEEKDGTVLVTITKLRDLNVSIPGLSSEPLVP